MKIKIKRATTKGLKENEGDMFETNGKLMLKIGIKFSR